MKSKNESRFSKKLAISILVFVLVGLVGLGNLAAKNLKAEIDISLGDIFDGVGLGLELAGVTDSHDDYYYDSYYDPYYDSYNSSGGGGNATQPDCGSSDCLTVPGTGEYKGISTLSSLREAILTWTNFFLGFLALIAMLALIYAGFLYVTTLGNEEQAKKAKNIVAWVVIGIIVIFLAYALVNTLITTGPTGSDLTETET